MSAQYPFHSRQTKGEVTLILDNKETVIPWVQPNIMVHLIFKDEKTAQAYHNNLLSEVKNNEKLSGIEKSKLIKNYAYEDQIKCALPITYKQLQAISKFHLQNKSTPPSQEGKAAASIKNDENASPPGGPGFK